MAIALELLSPNACGLQQTWIFESESVVRVGRASDNQIVLNSSAISEYHAMLWGDGNQWKIVNLSCNSTYLDDKPITHALLKQDAIIRLAPSGPQLRVHYLAQEAVSSQLSAISFPLVV
ncbi:FHA domain-containing protein [Kovacikia minuta CCNUW1]|uniref:FHA domain-containing protein n=1 Tax=Kovacikia minuta TaxID=2931930 RepID=UPI001CCB38A5|nr:FHA domain-containing protein [Kovacikia minuta]UBF25024.1 FHA domain-containing protein [Kovacikia minuta CCNUW1]